MSVTRPPSHTEFSWPGVPVLPVPASHTPYSWGSCATGSGSGSGAGAGAGAVSSDVLARLERVEAAAKKVTVVHAGDGDGGSWQDTTPGEASWWTDGVGRVEADLRRRGLMGTAICHVPSDYYDRSLMQRSILLHSSPPFLCKCVLLENRAYKPSLASHPNPCVSSRFLCVVLQYITKLDVGMLVSKLCGLSSPPLAMGSFELMLASEADSFRLSGYKFNAVTPFGMTDPNVPMVVSSSAAALPYVWLGGGAVDVKVKLSTGQLVSTLGATVFDCTVLRSADDDE